ncbi:bifunctional tryptophan synthase TRP1 [Pisolithus croceorrhizus]|nr:bifunctional tryptophan synthase TRP1 [Pisolithus croceorrhizus]
MQAGGDDITEVGIPFSDPVAEGPAIQETNLVIRYYNPIFTYGEDKAAQDVHEAGANGFLVVDLPPGEASRFREKCTNAGKTQWRVYGLSHVPPTALSTSLYRLSYLTSITDSFNYVVPPTGSTGSSVKGFVNSELPVIITHARKHTSVPLAMVFGVATCLHFDAVVEVGADGVVIGSRIRLLSSDSSTGVRSSQYHYPVVAGISQPTGMSHLSPHFGQFGGQLNATRTDPTFWAEFESHYSYMYRPSTLCLAESLTKEDLNHIGSHKINNAVGQILLAKQLRKTRVITETGTGQHGVATATVCARFGMECIIYMGAEDVRRQALNVFRVKMLGAEVMPAESGSKTLKDAANEAMRDWVTNLVTTHSLIGFCFDPHPFPTIVCDYQKVIGREVKAQMEEAIGKLPDVVVACVGSGSNAIGCFYEYIPDTSVHLVGVEAGGEGGSWLGIDDERHNAILARGKPGVLHGVRTYVLQDPAGQIVEMDTISAGWDYPAVGPEHSWLKDSGRAEYVAATDEEALRGLRLCTQLKGIIPACLSGRCDKSVGQISESLHGKWAVHLD